MWKREARLWWLTNAFWRDLHSIFRLGFDWLGGFFFSTVRGLEKASFQGPPIFFPQLFRSVHAQLGRIEDSWRWAEGGKIENNCSEIESRKEDFESIRSVAQSSNSRVRCDGRASSSKVEKGETSGELRENRRRVARILSAQLDRRSFWFASAMKDRK